AVACRASPAHNVERLRARLGCFGIEGTRGSGVTQAQLAQPGHHTILVRGRQLDREITEGMRLARQDPAGCLFLLLEYGGRAASVLDLAGGQAHLARTAAAPSAAEGDTRP